MVAREEWIPQLQQRVVVNLSRRCLKVVHKGILYGGLHMMEIIRQHLKIRRDTFLHLKRHGNSFRNSFSRRYDVDELLMISVSQSSRERVKFLSSDGTEYKSLNVILDKE
jgi:hypothetical protein